jgi:hypothetical protein
MELSRRKFTREVKLAVLELIEFGESLGSPGARYGNQSELAAAAGISRFARQRLPRLSESSWRLFELQSAEMRPLCVTEGGLRQAFDALFRARVHQ